MVGGGAVRLSLTSINMETTCGALLSELEQIWTEIGETDAEKDEMLLELERECLQVYRKKVDEASNTRALLRRSIATKEAEFATLVASLGEHNVHMQTDKRQTSLKEQLSYITPVVENLKLKKEESLKQLVEIKSEIDKIRAEIDGRQVQLNVNNMEETELSIRKLNDYQAQLRSLQKEKSERLHKILEDINEVHSLCSVLDSDFSKTVDEVHPSLHETGLMQFTNISDSTLKGLSQLIQKLKSEKKTRVQKLREVVESLLELWNLLNSPKEERKQFEKLSSILSSSEDTVAYTGILSVETIKEAVAEVERLNALKASKMKDLVLKKRLELEEVCQQAHIEPDMSTAPEKLNALMDSGLVDPSELLTNIEAQIAKAKEECNIRKDIMDKVSKWQAACAEEKWLEEYNQDENRYNAGRGGHLNLKRAEKARLAATKIPAIVDNLMNKTLSWEDERNKPFLYDGVRLVTLLEEYKLAREQREEEKKRFRDHKKLQNLLLTEKEAMFGSKPSPKRSTSFRKPNGNENGFMTPKPRRISAGSATPELLTPRSFSGRHNSHFKELRRLSTTPLNFVAIPKEDTVSSFASISGSEPGSPPRGSQDVRV
ncbi:65-kDa microtubule-associated protein 6 [Apostasia shenzhenica]|uniref:65-kDa microtubule-associated protein 6 n=1 Tax=Apostasia shenzhenica TaxID=1088818 RepID=A0A2I0B4Q7_9ASPA|nr:65-kDa microtubule-associated protein 6 [Apostasia shenzhenica]